MNKNQFIQSWAPNGREKEMEEHLDLVIKEAVEESRCFMPSDKFE